MKQTKHYYPALDGLRFLSLLAIIFYHYYSNQLPGGFLAVNLFFVLSGFLLTHRWESYLLEDKPLQLGKQWLRRFDKLSRPLWLFISLWLIFLLLFRRDLLVNIRPSVIASVLFVNNWQQIYAGSSYFAEFLHPSIFTHLWYLSVYLQIITVYSIVYGTLRPRLSKVKFTRLIMGLSLVSALLMAVIYSAGADPSRVYYGTDTRLFSFLVGAVAALVAADLRKTVQKYFKNGLHQFLPLLLMTLMYGMFKLMSDQSVFTYRGGMLFFDILAAALVITLTQWSSIVGKLLTFKPMTWLGRKNYSVYLFYYPIYILLAAHGKAASFIPLPMQIILIFILAVIFDYLSHLLVWKLPTHSASELPLIHRISQKFNWSSEKLVRYLRITLVAILLFGGMITAAAPKGRQVLLAQAEAEKRQAEIDEQNRKRAAKQAKDSEDLKAYQATLDPDQQRYLTNFSDEELIQAQKLSLTFIGDSQILKASPAIRAVFPGANIAASVGLQVAQATDYLDEFSQHYDIHDPVVFALGTNGTFTSEQLDEALAKLGDRKIYIVNTSVDRYWRDEVNMMLAEAAANRPNCELIDWYSFYLNHAQADWLDIDAVHLTPSGVQAWTDFVGSYLIEELKR